VETITPNAALLQLCGPPGLVRTETVRNIVDNSNARQDAYDSCAARMCRLVQWIQKAVHGEAVACDAKEDRP